VAVDRYALGCAVNKIESACGCRWAEKPAGNIPGRLVYRFIVKGNGGWGLGKAENLQEGALFLKAYKG